MKRRALIIRMPSTGGVATTTTAFSHELYTSKRQQTLYNIKQKVRPQINLSTEVPSTRSEELSTLNHTTTFGGLSDAALLQRFETTAVKWETFYSSK